MSDVETDVVAFTATKKIGKITKQTKLFKSTRKNKIREWSIKNVFNKLIVRI